MFPIGSCPMQKICKVSDAEKEARWQLLIYTGTTEAGLKRHAPIAKELECDFLLSSKAGKY